MFRLASFALFLCASAQDDTKPHALLGSVPLMDMTMAELHQIKLIRDDGPNFFADVNAIEQGPCNVDESCKAKNAGPETKGRRLQYGAPCLGGICSTVSFSSSGQQCISHPSTYGPYNPCSGGAAVSNSVSSGSSYQNFGGDYSDPVQSTFRPSGLSLAPTDQGFAAMNGWF
eukprot:GHVP01053928.1.p1 GENE.GHVP01053928.1~~GHVP01053928.1.p1  ORF type:complete len:172 (+),score=22.32 GHVP01053928.1:313-828(+)